MNNFLFELCAENLESAKAAEFGGASRIELCAELAIGGVTPSIELTTAVLRALSIPVHVLIRPRGGNFVYSAEEFAVMQRQVAQAKQAGAAGVVLGMLRPDCRVEVERSRALVELAHPMTVTFHRAFDATPDLSEALEAVIETGADCLLTSGGEPDVLAGAEAIRRLRTQAGERLSVMAGGGLRLANLVEVVQRTGVSLLHGSLTGERENEVGAKKPIVSVADVREAVRLFSQEVAKRQAAAR
ncbi:MAG: copper homeostasis protein CutC [Terracidiphilus sp.]|nr:copper homeostasis protein CutC [Terracidiphilus sp.]MDR3776185.1 copper homeostasis protein CutC [Terracidiphilus sp.]